jgi:ABC-type uncharacterized transport system ATPase subunit
MVTLAQPAPTVVEPRPVTGPEAAIEVSDLVKRFGSFTAVDRLTFSVQPGEIFGFLGPNGAGKSTTIKMLCTLLQPTAGTAIVNGFDVARHPDRVRASIGIIFQDYNAWWERHDPPTTRSSQRWPTRVRRAGD